MVVVSGEFDVAEKDWKKAIEIAKEMASATRDEAGCLYYAFYCDIENPAMFRVFEEWQDGAALEAHFETPHMKKFRKDLSAIKITRREVKRYEVSGTSLL